MERLENQPCEWDDHLLAQALESEQRREQEEQKLQEDEELKKLQVFNKWYWFDKVLSASHFFHWEIQWIKGQGTGLKVDRFRSQAG